MSKHGGKREGAGRPALDAEKMVTRSIRMPMWMVDAMKEIDGGNGLSMLTRHALMKTYKLKPPPELKAKILKELSRE